MCHDCESCVPLIARLSIGYVFVTSGWGKFQHLEGVVGFFQSLGIPLASVQAPLVATLEVVFGLFLALGFMTGLSSLILIAIMAVAILTAKLGDVGSVGEFIMLPEYLFILLLAWLAARGPGRWAADDYWGGKGSSKKKR